MSNLVLTTATISDGNQATIVAAQGVSSFIRVYSHDATNGASAILRLDIKEGSTVKISRYLAANGGGFLERLEDNRNAEKGTGGLVSWDLPLNTALTAQLSGAPASNDVRYNVQYRVIDTSVSGSEA